MARSISRSFYRCLLRLHPSAFRTRFADEMLWIFDEVAPREGVTGLFGDAFWSLARQWTVRVALSADSPYPATTPELFAWERIGSPSTSLPAPRIVQGGFVSLLLVGVMSTLAVATSSLPPFPSATCEVSAPAGHRPLHAEAPAAKPLLHAYVQVQAVFPKNTAISAMVITPQSVESWFSYPILVNGATSIPDLDSPLVLPSNNTSATASSSARILTAQYDNARTGANLNEKLLTPANVNSNQFGKLFTLKVDGDVYAQPLYLPDVEIPGKGKHNLLFIATENDSVYAFDAEGASADPLWHANLAESIKNAAPLSDRDTQCFFIVPQVGITSTPVIDIQSGTIYVLARTKESKGVLGSTEYKQRLHALAITTGAEKFGGPVEIKASVKGVGAGDSNGQVAFDPLRENPRAALLLAKDTVYLSWGSSCDIGPYHGWLMSYDAHTLAQNSAFNTSPNGSDGAIWQGDAGPAADKEGNVFVVTGNGDFDPNGANGRDYGDSVLKLSSAGGQLKLADYFTPSNQAQLNAHDNDLGSSGPVLLPDQPGPHPHVLVTAGKEGKIYVIDRDSMGKFQPGDDPHAIQTIDASKGAFGAMAYWNQQVFFIGSERAVQDFAVDHGQLKWKANGDTRFLDSGATPVVSSNGAQSGIVWAASSKNWNEPPRRAAVLYAFDANDVRHQLYSSEQNSGRDRPGTALRFAMPSVVNGKVYLGSKGQVDVYGLLPTQENRNTH
jgi:hypothetical protein